MKKEVWMWIALVVMSLVLIGLVTAIVVLEIRDANKTPPPAPTTVPNQTAESTTLPPPPPNVFDPNDFVYGEDGYLTCTAGEYRRNLPIQIKNEEGEP